LVLNPADFLRLEVVHDDILGAVPSPSALAAFDQWGFRNPKVPDTADIVALAIPTLREYRANGGLLAVRGEPLVRPQVYNMAWADMDPSVFLSFENQGADL